MIHGIPPAICESPIFIIGSPRSGTSVLAWALHQHAALWTSRESDLFYNMLHDKQMELAFAAARDRPEGTWLSEQKVGPNEFLGHLGLGLNALWTNRSRGKRWIDQTPVNTMIVETLADTFPGAVFLHIVRDPRRVVHSMLNFRNMLSLQMQSAFQSAGQVADWMTGFSAAAETWARFVDQALTFAASQPRRCLTVANESLVADSQEAFDRIHVFLGVESHQSPARFFRENRINSSFAHTPEGKPGPRISRPWQGWTDSQKAIFMDTVGPVLRKLRLYPESECPEYLA
jgi:hypothetical protein